MKSLIIGIVAVWASLLPAQTVINGGRTVKGPWDASGAMSTKPVKMGTATPGTCSSGELFFNTSDPAGQNVYLCNPANTWNRVTVDAANLIGSVPAAKLPGTINSSTTGNATTATALAAAPNKCAAGSYSVGIDASGNAQGCTTAPSGIRVIAAGICVTCATSSYDTILKTVTIPAGYLGTGDVVRIWGLYSIADSADTVRNALLFGGASLVDEQAFGASDGSLEIIAYVYVLGASSEKGEGTVGRNGTPNFYGTGIRALSINTANTIDISYKGGFSGGSGGTIGLEAYTVEILKAQ